MPVDDLERLIDMAEKVSESLSSIDDRLSSLKLKLFFTISLAYIGMFVVGFIFLKYRAYFDISDLLLASLVVAAIFVSVIGFLMSWRIFQSIKRDIKTRKVEVGVLHHLLDMIHEYKSHLLNGETLSFVELAIIDIRLKRIEYSGV